MATATCEVPVAAEVAAEATEFEVRVRRGALHLDATVPGWADKVDVGTLDIGSCFDCIIGQLVGPYHLLFFCDDVPEDGSGLARLGLDHVPSASWREDHGFTVCGSRGGFASLRAAWVAEILPRRAG